MGERSRTYLSQGWTGVDGNLMLWKSTRVRLPLLALSLWLYGEFPPSSG